MTAHYAPVIQDSIASSVLAEQPFMARGTAGILVLQQHETQRWPSPDCPVRSEWTLSNHRSNGELLTPCQRYASEAQARADYTKAVAYLTEQAGLR